MRAIVSAPERDSRNRIWLLVPRHRKGEDMSIAFGITLTCVMGGLFAGYVVGGMIYLNKFEQMITSNVAQKKS